MSPDLIGGALWSLGGLIVGYGLGYFSRQAADGDPTAPQPPRRRASRTEILRAVIGLVLLLLVLASTVRYYRVTSCQQGYLQAVQTSLTARSDAQGAEAEAQIELLTTPTGGDPTAGRVAVQRYVDALRELERVRRENPLPGPDSCGDTS
jgi:hypothetical protein